MSGRLLGRKHHEEQVNDAANRDQSENGSREGKTFIQTAHRRRRNRSGGCRPGCGCWRHRWPRRNGRCAGARCRSGGSGRPGCRGSCRSGRSPGRSARRQRRQLDRRRGRGFRRQIDADGFFLRLNLAGFLFRRNGTGRDVGYVLCHKVYVVKIGLGPMVSNSYSEKQIPPPVGRGSFLRQHFAVGAMDLIHQRRLWNRFAVQGGDRDDAEHALREENTFRIPQRFRLDDAFVRGQAE